MPLEAPNLDNRTYDGMLEEVRRKIVEYCPGWTDLGASDPGSVLLEAFTYLTDQMIYRLNRLPEKAFLEFLKLIGLRRRAPASAGVLLRFSVESALERPLEIPRGTRVTLRRSGAATEAPVFVTARNATLKAGETSVDLQARHGELVAGELLGKGTGKPGQSVGVLRAPIVSPTGDGLDLIVGVEASPDELSDRVPALQFQGKPFRIWREVENFTDLGPDRFVYVSDRLTGTITFAPAISVAEEGAAKPAARRPEALGERPVEGREIRAWYLRGGGAEGNVAAGTLDTLKDPIPHLKVTNPAAATGGRAAETLANAMLRGPQELHSLKRAVTASDFELVAMKNQGAIDRARAFTKATLWKHAAPGTVEVLLVPHLPGDQDGNVAVSPERLQERQTEEARLQIQKSLDERRPLGTACQVSWVRTKPVRAKAKVVVHREEDPKAVERRLMTRLNQIINPLRTPVRPSGWPFGEPLRAFHVYETVRSEPGVSYVEDIQFVVDDVPDQNLRSITQDMFQPHTWHAASGDTVFRTMDDGAGWEVSGRFKGEEVVLIRVHPEEPGLLAVVSQRAGEKAGSRISVSRDCGESWEEVALTGFGVEDMAWTKRGEGVPVLLLATEVGLYELVLRPDRKPVPQQLLVNPEDPSLGFYAVAVADLDIGEKVVVAAARGTGGVYLSSEGGRSQTYRLTGLSGEDIRVLAVEYAAGSVYFWAGAVAFGDDPGKGCFRLQVIDPRNTPEGWRPFGAGWSGGGVKSIALMGTTVFAATVSAGVLWLSSTDKDPKWKLPDFVRCGLPQKSQGRLLTVEDIAVDPGNRLIFAVGAQGVYSSQDRGLSYEKRSRHEFETVTLPPTWLFSSLEPQITVVSEDEAEGH